MKPRGAALLVVLWLLVLLVGGIGLFVLQSQGEALASRGQRVQVQLEQAAEGGVEAAVVGLLRTDPNRRLVPDGRPYAMAWNGLQVEVRIRDESGKIDINVADAALLARLLEQLGESRETAIRLAAAIIDWRDGDILVTPGGAEDREYRDAGLAHGPANQPFARLSDLQRVLGMTYARVQRLAPHVTVHTGQAQPVLAFAAEPVLLAAGFDPRLLPAVLAARAAWRPGLPPPALPGGMVLAAGGSGTYSIESRAGRSDGSMASLQATIRVGAGGFLGQVYTPLVWHFGTRD